MGPLQQLFAHFNSMPHGERYAALQRMYDDGGPIVLDGPPSVRGFYDAELPQRMPLDEYVSRPPMPFRDPAQQGPSPPGMERLAAMYR